MQRLQAFKYDLMPDSRQERQMRRFACACRYVFNKALALQQAQQSGQSSLGIADLEDAQFKIVRPNFIFFAEQDGKIVTDLVDPPGLRVLDLTRADARQAVLDASSVKSLFESLLAGDYA